MNRKTLAAIAFLTATSATAWAASVHWKGGRGAGPSFSDEGLVLDANGCLAGLGEGDVQIVLSASAIPDATCTNKGGTQAPGQNPATVDVSGTESIPSTEIKNGNLCFDVETQPPPQPTWYDAGCPNSNWTAEITDLDFTSAQIDVYQGGVLVFSSQTYQL